MSSEGLAVLLIVALMAVLLPVKWLLGLISSWEPIQIESVTLSCPHCGEQTVAHRKTCQQCGGELQS